MVKINRLPFSIIYHVVVTLSQTTPSGVLLNKVKRIGETTRRMGRHIKEEQSVKRVLRRDKQKAKKTGRDHK